MSNTNGQKLVVEFRKPTHKSLQMRVIKQDKMQKFDYSCSNGFTIHSCNSVEVRPGEKCIFVRGDKNYYDERWSSIKSHSNPLVISEYIIMARTAIDEYNQQQ